MIVRQRRSEDAASSEAGPSEGRGQGQNQPIVVNFRTAGPERLYLALALGCGLIVFLVSLAFHSVADGDLWAKLALGASLWEGAPGGLPTRDFFAFTPVLPRYVDHEWGAGWVFFGLLKFLGPTSLMVLKLVLATGALGLALRAGWRSTTTPAALLVVAAPAALCVLPAYVPVIRSHAFTFLLFAATLWCLERLSESRKVWPGVTLIGLMGIWANLHGGWVAGFGIAGLYALMAMVHRDRPIQWIALLSGCLAVTLINPYGLEYWRCLIPAILHARPFITEWQPMPLLAVDAFIGFRVLVVLVFGLVLLAGRPQGKESNRKAWTGLVILAVTAFLAFRSRRHAPFFGIAALFFVGPYLQAAWQRIQTLSPTGAGVLSSRSALAVLVGYVGLAFWAALTLLPQVSLQVIAPVGAFPVREADILAQVQARGNLAVPFSWGSYASWRLHPGIKVNIDGRYEAAYPESTFLMAQDFFDRRGTNWDRLVREFPVDFVILDLQSQALRPVDLRPYGFELAWQIEGVSALLARGTPLGPIREAALHLPPTTIEPLDPAIPRRWWTTKTAAAIAPIESVHGRDF